MLESFFFVPAHKPKFIQNVKNLKADYIIYDFEEAVPETEKYGAIESFPYHLLSVNSFARSSLGSIDEEQINTEYFRLLDSSGFRSFVLPKVRDVKDLEHLADGLADKPSKYRFLLLVENARCLMSLKELLQSEVLPIWGLALGSHDYASSMGLQHNLPSLEFARQLVVHYAKAYGLKAIDIASMDLIGGDEFQQECVDGYQKAYDAKFILHPNQLHALLGAQYHSAEEITKMRITLRQLSALADGSSATVTVDGVLYERPHLKHMQRIINWYDIYGNK